MKTIFTFFICCLIVAPTFAQPGTLDRSFGDTGVVITPINNGGLSSIILQSDGKIIGAGAAARKNMFGFTLTRYLPNGKLDSSFGTQGISFINNRSEFYSAVVLHNNSIIATGISDDNNNIIIVKYTSNGSLDSTFGDNGQVHESFKGVDATIAAAIKVQQDGKIVIAGLADFIDEEGAYEPQILTARFNADGSVDESFGEKGYVLLKGQIANSLIIQPDGKIVIGGNTGLDEKFILARYLQDGSLDTDFGNSGIVKINFNNHEDYINTLALQPDGKIVAAGVEDHGTGNMIAARFLTDGSLDNSFGTDGYTVVKFEDGSQARSMVLQADGKIILAGYSNPSFNLFYFALARLNTNGIIDSSFGTNGLAETNIDGKSYGISCALQQDGKIILGGMNTDATNFILARYNNNSQNKTPLARIKKWIQHHILHWQNMASDNIAYYTIERSNNATGSFKQIAKIKSETGNAKSEIYNYALPVNTGNLLQANFYRINAINSTGNIIASAIVEDTEDAAAISIYPNPVKDILYIKGLDENAKYEIRITNEKGNVFAKATVNKLASYNLNVQNLHKGIYYAAIISLSRKPVLLQFLKE